MNIKLRSFLLFSAGALTIAVAGLIFSFRTPSDKDSPVDVQHDGRLQYKWYAPELPKSISFAGEKVPLERQEIREQLERELIINYYAQSGTLYMLKLTTRYFPLIEQRLRANGVPDDFKYLCVAESALRDQTSKAGAVGFWQFMKDTAPKYGLTVNDDVDERYNVTKATDAACIYLKDAHEKFGSWTAAAASYNCGLAGFSNQATYQRTNDYYSLLLPEETMRYIFRIVALKQIVTEASRMGYMLDAGDMYKPYRTKEVDVTATIPDLEQYAVDNGTTYRVLKTLNPWMRGHSLPVREGKTYQVQLPAAN